MSKKPSKSDRWADACTRAISALEELEEMRQEWADTYENLNEGLQQTPYGLKLEAMSNLDIESAKSTVEEAEMTEIPLGFGRD